MLNQAILVGRIATDTTDGNIKLSVQRSYKNSDGIYESDLIDVKLYDNIAKNVAEYCHKGDLVGIKGRLEEGGIVTAEKVTFLSNAKNN